jgi:hypothetical protein
MKVHLHELASAVEAQTHDRIVIVDDAGRTIGLYQSCDDVMANAKWDIIKLANAVRTMRHRQREYFASRDPGRLNIAKAAEREVDRLLAELDAPEPKQGGLF